MLQVQISAENKDQADKILDALMAKKLVVGGIIIEAPAKWWWKGEIVEMSYCKIECFTLEKYKEEIIKEVEKVSREEVPMISFIEFSGNKIFENWIEDSLS